MADLEDLRCIRCEKGFDDWTKVYIHDNCRVVHHRLCVEKWKASKLDKDVTCPVCGVSFSEAWKRERDIIAKAKAQNNGEGGKVTEGEAGDKEKGKEVTEGSI